LDDLDSTTAGGFADEVDGFDVGASFLAPSFAGGSLFLSLPDAASGVTTAAADFAGLAAALSQEGTNSFAVACSSFAFVIISL
jgi:hypothetical protein